jgi:hypothetical protein
MIATIEARKQAGTATEYMLSLIVTMTPADTIESEFIQIREAILNWAQVRGPQTRELMFVVTTDPGQHQHIADFLKTVALKDEALASVLRRIRRVYVNLLALDGQPRLQYELAGAAQPSWSLLRAVCLVGWTVAGLLVGGMVTSVLAFAAMFFNVATGSQSATPLILAGVAGLAAHLAGAALGFRLAWKGRLPGTA